MSVLQLKPETKRRPGPYAADRHCACGAKLSRYNPSGSCAPCSGGDWIPGEPSEFEIRKLQKARLEEIAATAA